MPTLFDPIQLGSLTLPNRILMAPLTRTRASDDVLLAARFGRADRDRGDANFAHGQGVQQYARDSFP